MSRVSTKDYLSPIPPDWQATLAVGHNKSAKPGEWKNKRFTLDGMIGGLSAHSIGPKDGPCFLQGNATGGVRHMRSMERLFIVGIDVDNGMPSTEIDAIVRQRGLFCIRYTTHSHGKDYTEVRKDDWVKYLRANDGATIAEYLVAKKRYLPEVAEQAEISEELMTPEGLLLKVTHPAMDKNRLIFVLSRPWSVHDYDTQEDAIKAWKDSYMSFSAWLGIAVDQSCTDPSRLFYLPRREGGALYEAVVHKGDAINIFALPKATPARQSSGNVFLDAAAAMGAKEEKNGSELRYWAAKNADKFLIYDALLEHAPHVLRPEKDHDAIHHIECPFESEHTSFGGTGTFVANAGEGKATGFVIKCQHNSCAERDRLEFLAEMLKLEWLPREALDDERFLLDVEDDGVEPEEAETASEPEEMPDRPSLAMVKDAATANEYLQMLVDSGATAVDAAEELDKLANRMKFELRVPLGKAEILRTFNRLMTETNRRKREDRKAEEQRRKDAEKRRKEKEREREAISKKEYKEKQAQDEVKKGTTAERPVIFVDTTDHLEAVETALASLVRKNSAKEYIFRNAGGVSRIVHDELNLPRAERVGVEEMRFELCKVSRYLETSQDAFKEIPATNNVVKHILADPALPFPTLGGIVTAPVFGADGVINTQPGYSKSSQLYFEPPDGLKVPFVPHEPTKEDVDHALDLLMGNALVDFPFDGPNNGASERAHALCMVLQPFARQLIGGATPIYLIVKPTPGTGASKLVNIYSLISTGEEAIAQTETRSEDEIRKRVTSVLMESSPTFYLDNINYRIDSSALASAVTSSFWTDRLLGETKTVRVPVKHTWIFAGNNVTMSNEIARRCVRIRLDAKVERPELRTAFKHKDLEGWVRENRAELIWACLTLIQNWISVGRPEGTGTKGSFEPWSRVIGGVLQAAGIEGFLANDGELREDADEEGNAIKAMISLWWNNYADTPVTVGGGMGEKSLFDLIEDEEIPLPIQGATPQQRKVSCGKYVGKLGGRIFTIDTDDGSPIQVRIDKAGKKDNKVRWKLFRLN